MADNGVRQARRKKRGSGEESDDHDLHIWTERERRKKMRNMFSNLHALLPHIPPKADKSTVVDEAVKYIKKLEDLAEEMEKLRAERPSPTPVCRNPIPNPGQDFPATFKTWTSANVTVNVCGRDAHISICSGRSRRRSGLLTGVCSVMEKHELELVSAHISSSPHSGGPYLCVIHSRAEGGSGRAFPVEEVYRRAAAEIILWVNS